MISIKARPKMAEAKECIFKVTNPDVNIDFFYYKYNDSTIILFVTCNRIPECRSLSIFSDAILYNKS